MKENLWWFIGGYVYCVIVTLIMDYNGKKKVKNEIIDNQFNFIIILYIIYYFV